MGAASTLQEISRSILKMFEQEEVDEEDLLNTVESLEEASDLTLSNLRRATRLVSSFKHCLVDQSSRYYACSTLEKRLKMLITVYIISLNTPHQNHYQLCRNFVSIWFTEHFRPSIDQFNDEQFHHGFDDGRIEGNIIIDISKKKGKLILNTMTLAKA
ncbi:MAG: hypothetical protein R3E08_05730 [Thiotrichaceae bacterium]